MGCNTPTTPHIYLPDQMAKYFERIELPEKWKNHSICSQRRAQGSLQHEDAVTFLGILQGYQITAFPSENLDLHYSLHRSIKIDAENVFQKLVGTENGRGGYCMELNVLFLTVLRTLGYDVYPTGARVNTAVRPKAEQENFFMGWNHMINIVTDSISGNLYSVEVGFGSRGPHHPMLLPTDIRKVVGCESHPHRISLRQISELTARSPSQALYVHEFSSQSSDSLEDKVIWIPAYCFSLMEFTMTDFEYMNYYTSTNPNSIFVQSVFCVKMVVEAGELVEDVSLFEDTVKWRRMEDGELKTLKTWKLESEDERVRALEEMGVRLTKDEREAIRGFKTEIVSGVQRIVS